MIQSSMKLSNLDQQVNLTLRISAVFYMVTKLRLPYGLYQSATRVSMHL